MSFLYGAKDKISSIIKSRLFCTIMISLFTHYRKSRQFKKVSTHFKRSYFLLVCDTYIPGIPYSVLSRAGYMTLNLGETRNQKKLFISSLPVLHSPMWLIDRANFEISHWYVCSKFIFILSTSVVNIRHNP